MNKSEELKDLFAAMSKFQGEITNAFKGKAGHGYNYADLAMILDMIREPLSSNGLSIVQMPAKADPGYIAVETMVSHSSGQWIECLYDMKVPENKRNSSAQNVGSAITYARRYAVAAALGISQTDTDATPNLNGEDPKLTVQDVQWIKAVKDDSAIADQISDLEYRAFILLEAAK